MDHAFTNKDAIVFGSIAIVEFICFYVYVSTASVRLRRKIISMGRLIPTIQVVVTGSVVTPGRVVQTCPQNLHPFPQAQYTQPPPPPPGFLAYDSPPPYSECAANPPKY